MPRREVFYAPAEQFQNLRIVLTGEEHRHLSRVLHHRVGERIIVVDGAGLAVDAEIVSLQRERTELRVLKKMRRYGESFTQITLAAAVPKGSRFDWIVEKATELGVVEIVPMHTERTETEAKAAKIARWQRLALAAMKQCCRSYCPTVRPLATFAEVCRQSREFDVGLIAHEAGGDVLRSLMGALPPRKILVCIGPEGGFTEDEIEAALACGAQTLGLGPRRLRADTAALAAVAKILTRLGQMDS